MAVQTHLFPEAPEPPAQPGIQPGSVPPPPRPRSSALAPVWLQRLSLFILVLFCVYLGVIVAVLPWATGVWDHNLFFISHPRLWAVLRLGPVRGIISGLGLLDIWIGISEAIHYRDQRN